MLNCLTDREREVIELVKLGYTNIQIAEKLNITTHTVKKHLRHIFDKWHIKNRVQATAIALKHNIKI